jgi:hypothetical protein
MTSRTDDYHCKRCGAYMFSAYTVHMGKDERDALDNRAESCNKCRATSPVATPPTGPQNIQRT